MLPECSLALCLCVSHGAGDSIQLHLQPNIQICECDEQAATR